MATADVEPYTTAPQDHTLSDISAVVNTSDQVHEETILESVAVKIAEAIVNEQSTLVGPDKENPPTEIVIEVGNVGLRLNGFDDDYEENNEDEDEFIPKGLKTDATGGKKTTQGPKKLPGHMPMAVEAQPVGTAGTTSTTEPPQPNPAAQQSSSSSQAEKEKKKKADDKKPKK